ncbi:MAG: hypothetical protein HYY24_23775 [Verrucomicrobia bacterium]|nr:hypothetical protein [Verrucomicrobiota bacterium]
MLWHGLAFLTIITLTWCDGVFDLAHFVLNEPRTRADLADTALKTSVLFLIWAGSAYKLFRIVSRLSYLEEFLRVCAWCRRIEFDSQWLSLEDHYTRQTGKKTTHGICPECQARLLAQLPGSAAPAR